MNLTKKQIEQIKETKSVDELSKLAKESGIDATDKEIGAIFNVYHNNSNKKVIDAELAKVAGGSQMHNWKTYSDGVDFGTFQGKQKYLIVTARNSCDYSTANTCSSCKSSAAFNDRCGAFQTIYCVNRYWDSDKGEEVVIYEDGNSRGDISK